MDNQKKQRVLVRSLVEIGFESVVTATADAYADDIRSAAKKRAQALIECMNLGELARAMNDRFEPPPGQENIALTDRALGTTLCSLDEPWVDLTLLPDAAMKGSTNLVVFTDALGDGLSTIDVSTLQQRVERTSWSADEPPPRVMRHWEMGGRSVCFLLDRAVPLGLQPGIRERLCEAKGSVR